LTLQLPYQKIVAAANDRATLSVVPTPPATSRIDRSPAGGAELVERELAAWRGFLRAHREVVAHLDDELQRAHDLPLSSYEVLLYLADAPEGRLRMGELAERLLLSRSGLTRLVDRLERRDLVVRERCQEDARGLFARITSSGRELFEAAQPDHLDGVRRHYLSRLTDEDIEHLTVAWRRITG
jgi:DNA-binding MarR family transcriptional regulator